MYIVGVDVAKRSHEATVIDANGNTIKKAFNFRNDADGFQKLMSALEAVSTNPSDFIVGMESTSVPSKSNKYIFFSCVIELLL